MPVNLAKHPELYDIFLPSKKPIGVLSIPHSGELIPAEFLPYLSNDQIALQADVDYQVNELVDIKRLNREGVIVLVSKIHRFAVDLNRPALESPLNWQENTKGDKIVMKSATESVSKAWVEKYHVPYYKTISEAIELCHKETKKRVSFVDLHSMPSKPTSYHLKKNPNQKQSRPDFCLSDLVGKSCEQKFMKFVESFLSDHNYRPVRNDPYQGGHITQFVNEIEETNNIQIEINRKLYMNEDEHRMNMSEANHLKHILTDLFIHLYKEFH